MHQAANFTKETFTLYKMEFALNIAHQERLLIQAVIKQEEWAQRKLYEMYYGRMMGVCLRYANNKEDALDILQDGFVKVFRKIHKYNQGTSLNAWIHRIMVNTSIDYYRREKRRQTENLEEAARHISYDASALSSLRQEEIISALGELTPAYRTVFNLFAIEGYAHKEIADFLMIAESTSRSNLLKARTQLKEILRKRGFKR